jgi:putative tricarboxylic transport membrane protein
MFRRTFVGGAAATAMAIGLAATANAFEPGNVECIAPANPGGGWDFTCRQVGKALSDLGLVPGQVQVTNMAGGGGGVAYAHVVTKRNDDDNLLVAASTATTTRLAQDQYVGMTADQVRFVGSLGADYGVIVVKADAPYETLGDLVEAVKADPSSVAFGGGSAAGGFDHLKVLQVMKAAGFDDIRSIKYVAFDGGGEAVTQLLGGHLQAMTGDISEVLGFVEAGDVKVLGVLSEERLPGDLSTIPTATEQGLEVVAPNWRGFYVPKGASDDAFAYWADAMTTIYESDQWKQIMADNGLMPFFRAGPDFQDFVDGQVADIAELSREIGIIN